MELQFCCCNPTTCRGPLLGVLLLLHGRPSMKHMGPPKTLLLLLFCSSNGEQQQQQQQH